MHVVVDKGILDSDVIIRVVEPSVSSIECLIVNVKRAFVLELELWLGLPSFVKHQLAYEAGTDQHAHARRTHVFQQARQFTASEHAPQARLTFAVCKLCDHCNLQPHV